MRVPTTTSVGPNDSRRRDARRRPRRARHSHKNWTYCRGTITPDTNYTYDPDGNQTTDSGTTLTWDSSNRLATTNTSTGSTTYTYDALDRVISQQDGSTVTQYSYAGMTTTPAGILDSQGNLIDTLVELPGGVTVTVPASGLGSSIWSYSNLQGASTLTTPDTGVPQGNPISYDPWGVPQGGLITNTPAGTPTLGAYAGSGKLTDPNNNLITMGARPFNPSEARFLTVDPIAGGCANPYTYAYGDPLSHPDITGEGWCPFPWTVIVKSSLEFDPETGEYSPTIEIEATTAILNVTGSAFAEINGVKTGKAIGSTPVGCLVESAFGLCDSTKWSTSWDGYNTESGGASLSADVNVTGLTGVIGANLVITTACGVDTESFTDFFGGATISVA